MEYWEEVPKTIIFNFQKITWTASRLYEANELGESHEGKKSA